MVGILGGITCLVLVGVNMACYLMGSGLTINLIAGLFCSLTSGFCFALGVCTIDRERRNRR